MEKAEGREIKGLVEAKVMIDFGKGIKRTYYITNFSNYGLSSGKHCNIEFCHPNFGEIFKSELR